MKTRTVNIPVRPSKKLRKAAEDWWCHPDLKKQLLNLAHREIGIYNHQLHNRHDPWDGFWAYEAHTYFANEVLGLLGEYTLEDLED